ncbi:hybrid sensor histidine kinase/response regulator [Hahella sp. HN01]|uniref:hybrid sensor histidine kinase/response regulator n=1 Tax=Hahella sp. HN01 TaxID=2847262 RepID=UPI001C1EBF7C|nr:hybrid sensor histidine kinase/response regulator [Hahella sp. HN01]MBU6951207.1 response regulator [Hahella sp. HN01]
MTKIAVLERALARERAARHQAEQLLELKATELYESHLLLEDALQKTAGMVHSLGDMVKDRTKKLEEARDEAMAANKAKSLFIANMSHEIRTPLNGVIGMLQAMMHGDLSREQKARAKTALTSGKLLLTVINDLLDFSKLEADKVNLERIPFSLGRLLDSCLPVVCSQASDKGLTLTLTLAAHLPDQIMGDPTRLKQIICNLLSNAVKFTKQGEVSLYCYPVEDRLMFGVADTGVGIPADRQQQIFEPFSQADDSHTRRYGGTGLGLSISSRLVEAMGGRLQVRSEPGVGADFYFSLPYLSLSIDGSTREPPPAPWADKPILLLAEESIAPFLKRGLRELGVDILAPSSSTEEALKALESAFRPFDLMLIHQQTPPREILTWLRHKHGDQNPIAVRVFGAQVDLNNEDVLYSELRSPIRPHDLFVLLQNHYVGENCRACCLDDHDDDDDAQSWWFGGSKVLLAEDNVVNQEVAIDLLSSVGVKPDVVDNGLSAVHAVQGKDYDLILMDVQMPELNGLDATRAIRALGGRFQEIPILAMTAHAQQSDRDLSRDAGMNGHIVKPFAAEELFETLGHWLRSKTPAPATRESIITAPAGGHDIPSLPGLNITEALQRLGGRWPLFQRILSGFYEKWEDAPKELQTLMEQNALGEIAIITHGLKGSGATIGAEALGKAAGAVESAARAGNQSQTHDLMAPLLQTLEEVLSGLSRLEQNEAAPAPSMLSKDQRPLLPQLLQLRDYLESDLGQAQKSLAQLRATVSDPPQVQALSQLEEALFQFDIEQAQTHLSQLIQTQGEPQ